MLLEALKKIGLSDKEATVYLASLHLGAAAVSTIAKQAKLNRSTTYLILEELKKKGLASQHVRGHFRYFNVVRPENLIGYIDRIKQNIDKHKLKIEELLPQFLNLINPASGTPKVTFLEGIEGIKEVYEDTLKEGVSKIYSFWAVDQMSPIIEDYLLNDYIPRRAKNKIFCYVIAPNLPKGRMVKKRDSIDYRKTVLVNSKNPFEIEINIYKDKVAFMSYKPGEEIGIIVQSTSIANTMRLIHKLCWK